MIQARMLADIITETDVLAPMRSSFTMLGGFFILVGVGVVVAWAVHNFWGRRRTTGTIIATSTTFGHHGGKSGTRLQIRYEAEGETCEIEAHAMAGSWLEGEPVTVRYIPGMPSDGLMPRFFFLLIGLFIGLLGGAFVAVAANVSAS